MKKKKNQTKKKKLHEAVLFYASPEIDADLLYFGGFFAPDSFLAYSVGGRRVAVLSVLERARAERESSFDEILPLEELLERARVHFRNKEAGLAEVVALIAKDEDVGLFRVGAGFPLGLAQALQKHRLRLEIAEEGVCPQRLIKTKAEAEAISQGCRAAAMGLRAAQRVLKAARIRGDSLYFDGKPLTAERLRYEIDSTCLAQGAQASRTIVAGGDQACDPHCVGSGRLYANELIIIDVFPRVLATGYHGDMTRTFLKGRASEGQRRLVQAVSRAQQAALGVVKARINGSSVHKAVEAVFADLGYDTERSGVPRGFFHSTGHGLGLEVHEAPRLGPRSETLRSGMVVTVEPGLYYPGFGGCRIEDVVQVTAKGCKKLSELGYMWEIR